MGKLMILMSQGMFMTSTRSGGFVTAVVIGAFGLLAALNVCIGVMAMRVHFGWSQPTLLLLLDDIGGKAIARLPSIDKDYRDAPERRPSIVGGVTEALPQEAHVTSATIRSYV